MTTDPVVIVGYARTPMGAFQGELGSVRAPKLGAEAIDWGRWQPPQRKKPRIFCAVPIWRH